MWSCKAIGPILEEISNEMSDKVDIYKVNVDENTGLAQEHGVQSIPTILVYKNGNLSIRWLEPEIKKINWSY